ncbi:MAG: 50S ribosomal protein L19 [Candidatus Latescibacterota bacterium]|nr:MAG: 50S ribosomal protein L19 [Candidatus Latescibacterota bacterium]
MDTLDRVERKYMKEDTQEFGVGDTVRVRVRVVEGDKVREQAFQGVVIQRRGGGVRETFTVRKISSGIGVERIFPLHSPNIRDIKVMRRGKVRRAKLYYLRNLVGKAARITEKKTPAKK